jgi:hypothetical protein
VILIIFPIACHYTCLHVPLKACMNGKTSNIKDVCKWLVFSIGPLDLIGMTLLIVLLNVIGSRT